VEKSINTKKGWVPKEKRQCILLITDDIRVTSGVAQIGREIVINTAHKYNYICVGGAIQHPDKGKKIDLSEEINKQSGIDDSSVFLMPTDGYGNPDLLRNIIKIEKPDAIFLITDPRYFIWVFQMENEIRKQIPIVYLNIWDSTPAPAYNSEFYESCDALFGISKQTVNINKVVLGDKVKDKIIKYIPHGLSTKNFYPIENETDELKEFKKYITKGKEYDFILLFNSRNIRRKSIPDTILAWKLFIDRLPKEKAEKCLLILHTEPISDHGTDIPAVIDYLFPNNTNIVISNEKLPMDKMNLLYNCADGTILLSSAEGWGLSLTESLLTGTPFIANVTGGMQDQMRFIDEKEEWYVPSPEIPSNHRGTYKKHGEWVLPVYPTNLSLVGSPTTPYIFDDRCSFEDASDRVFELYSMSKKERKERGKAGMEWALSDEAGFTSEKMSQRIIEGMDELFKVWEPRPNYYLHKDSDYEPRILKHKLQY
jgi:glycosyltransferase involved in cell wall biosynthesis